MHKLGALKELERQVSAQSATSSRQKVRMPCSVVLSEQTLTLHKFMFTSQRRLGERLVGALMTSFTDTSNWKRENETTLVYYYDYEGDRRDGLCEMEPQTVNMQLERLSLLDETSWRVKDIEDRASKPGFFTHEFITGRGILDNCYIHAITLDDSPNETLSRIDVAIYPAPLTELKATSVIDRWAGLSEGKRPEEGWLKDEIGRITYHSEGEYFEEAMFFATVFISQEKFDALASAIRQGNIRSARLSLLADLYHFGYESMGAGIRGHRYNYAIVCQDEGTSALWGTARGSGGVTKARLQELLIEWSPTLDARMAERRDEPSDVDCLGSEMPSTERDLEKVVVKLSQDVQAIRGRVDLFYQAVVAIVILIAFNQVLNWFVG